MQQLQAAQSDAHQQIVKSRIQQKLEFDSRHRDVRYKIGDRVWLLNHILSNAANYVASKY